MSDEAERVTGHFRSRLDQAKDGDSYRPLLEALSSPTLDSLTFDSGISPADRKEEWFRKAVLDLILDCVTTLLEDRPLSEADLAIIREIKRRLHIREGDFFKYRPVEIAALLCAELEKILEDLTIDTKEDLYQVELQAVFDLSYDQYLRLTRRAFEEAHETLETQLRVAQQTRDPARLTSLIAKAKVLEPIVELALSQPRTLGMLY